MDREFVKNMQKEACKDDPNSAAIVDMGETIASQFVNALPDCREIMGLKAATIPPYADDSDEKVKMKHMTDVLICAIYNAFKYDHEPSTFDGFKVDHAIEENDDGETEIWMYAKREEDVGNAEDEENSEEE